MNHQLEIDSSLCVGNRVGHNINTVLYLSHSYLNLPVKQPVFSDHLKLVCDTKCLSFSQISISMFENCHKQTPSLTVNAHLSLILNFFVSVKITIFEHSCK